MKNSVKVFNTFNNMLEEVERTHFDFTNGVLAITIFGGFKVNQKAVIIKDDPSLSPEKQLKATHKAQSAIIKRTAAYFKAKAKCDKTSTEFIAWVTNKAGTVFRVEAFVNQDKALSEFKYIASVLKNTNHINTLAEIPIFGVSINFFEQIYSKTVKRNEADHLANYAFDNRGNLTPTEGSSSALKDKQGDVVFEEPLLVYDNKLHSYTFFEKVVIDTEEGIVRGLINHHVY